jgi:hypothetical protein
VGGCYNLVWWRHCSLGEERTPAMAAGITFSKAGQWRSCWPSRCRLRRYPNGGVGSRGGCWRPSVQPDHGSMRSYLFWTGSDKNRDKGESRVDKGDSHDPIDIIDLIGGEQNGSTPRGLAVEAVAEELRRSGSGPLSLLPTTSISPTVSGSSTSPGPSSMPEASATPRGRVSLASSRRPRRICGITHSTANARSAPCERHAHSPADGRTALCGSACWRGPTRTGPGSCTTTVSTKGK